jgi:multidrug efflux pump
MVLSDVSIKRPVFALVMSLLLIVLGIISYQQLPLRELPDIDPPIVSVDTSYRGASAGVIESRITQIIEDSVSGIEGIESISSSSQNGRSSVNIEFKLSREIEGATNDVRDAVNRVAAQLPVEADPPQVAKVDADADPVLWLNLASTEKDTLELTDYAERFIVDRISAVSGVARVIVGGQQRYAMRIWINRGELAARGLTVPDVLAALRRENVELPAGRIESAERDFTVRVSRNYADENDFRQLPIGKGADGHVITLAEVADVELGSVERRSLIRGNGVQQIGLGIVKQSTANTLEVVRLVREEVDRVQATLPPSTKFVVAFDTSVYIDSAIKEVFLTLGISIVLVIVVIYLFIGSWRAALIPAVTVPVCVISSFVALYAFGFSINLITLLALVLSIGLVVDDAIVVLENCQRRVDLGEPRLIAAYRGAKQVAFAVIATTLVLVAVFLPIAFMEGNLGRLFRELAVAISAAMLISSLVALTLSPMMCSKLLRISDGRGVSGVVDGVFRKLETAYRRVLEKTLQRYVLVGAVVVGAIGLTAYLMTVVHNELTPPEDQGSLFIALNGPEGAGFDYTVEQALKYEAEALKLVEKGLATRVILRAPRGFGGTASEEMHTAQMLMFLAPWDQRDESAFEIINQLRGTFDKIPAMRANVSMRQGLSRGGSQPVQFVIGGPDYETLAKWRDLMLARIQRENQNLIGVDADYKETRPQMRVSIDRARAADLGVSVEEIGTTLETMLGARRATTFERQGEEYDVMLQARREDRGEPADLSNLYVRSRVSNELIPLANLVTLREIAEAGSLNRFNRLRAITINASLAPGYTIGAALEYMATVAKEELPASANIDYRGESRDYIKAGSTIAFTFLMALLVVFLVLAAQFESFVHPFVIMLTVPLALLGALLGLLAFGSTINLYSQIGIVILVGLAAKNGILIVEFANQLRDEGRSIHLAILEASVIRLRPIVMTSLSTVVGALPLVLASGAGSASRITIGIVIVAGVSFATLISLIVVPTFYRLLARYTRSPDELAREVDRLDRETAAAN